MITLVAASLLLFADLPTEVLEGRAVAADGDSLTLGNTRLRLFGIDAPELSQTCDRAGVRWSCGQEAAKRLSQLLQAGSVRCVPVNLDTYGRVVARCAANGVDINRTMVALGFAVAFREFSSEYVSAEDTARQNKRGLWSGTFEMPSAVRASARDSSPRNRQTVRSEQPLARAGACNIKGNRSRRGAWIYHVPGMPYYEETRAEEMFCSESDARAAGYRRARVR